MNDASMESAAIEGAAFNQYRLSWLAYLRPLVLFGVMLFLAFLLGGIHVAVIYAGVALAVAVLVYKIMVLRSVVLFVNDEGVWVYSGVLPWSKGIGGVRWRDVEDARYNPGFLGWALKSYTVRVGHRFTRGNEIVLPSVKQGDKAVEQINALLTDLGYDPGPVDGDYGRRTADAVKAFQRDAGITQDGWIDEDFLSTLRRAKAAYKPPVVLQPKPQTQTSLQPRSSTPSATTTTAAGYFTRGSHQDEVLRIQGRPDDINDYAALGYEEWKYGYSSVKLSSRDRRVLSWTNQGNLKVRLLPGNNVTSSTFYTRGSHQDDVLRIQGTPDDINDYSALGYEEWKYGYSSIKISSRDRRVQSWTNQGNLKVQLPPGRNTTTAPVFTRGSHQDDVLRVQGTPDDINDYSALGYEEWKYGYSSVKISTQNRMVISWTNQGNLKVRLSPGSNTTSAQYFSRNSHQDDVLRLQGTPDDINDYSALGYEEWKYGYSSVKISTRDRRVMGWDNNSGNLKAR